MNPKCPHCHPKEASSEYRPRIQKNTVYRRKSDCRKIRCYRCLNCGRYFSRATTHPAVRQKKRQFNRRIHDLLVSEMSQRRVAKLLRLSRTTVARKFKFLGNCAIEKLKSDNLEAPKVSIVEFDDMETFEHTKCKPLSITLAVEHRTRRILAVEVSQMAANGHLAKIAMKKYGPRKDLRAEGRARLFETLKSIVHPTAHFKSDQNPHYPADVKRHFPHATHEAFKGQRGSIVGQGELKKVRFDPLFSLNHTCAMFRANVNRLIRKTWCTTKTSENLARHLAMYAVYHNNFLLSGP